MVSLKDKFRGCIAASRIGSAMGAPVEGWSREQIAEKYGFVDRLLPYSYGNWDRPAGTTEDGIERQKLICTAIIEKQDRINAHDLVEVWLRDLDPTKMAYKQEPLDLSLLGLAKAGTPPAELGSLYPFPGVVVMARSSHPLGLINAGDPRGAADDTYDVGRVYAKTTAHSTTWAALFNAAIAEACKPSATVDAILETAVRFASYRVQTSGISSLYYSVADELSRALELAEKHTDGMAMRDEFYQIYAGGDYFHYGMSQANEIVSKGLAIFAFTKGNPQQAILTAVNFGRDTDCVAAVAGGIAGAFSGAQALPPEWIAQVDDATSQDPYTNSRRTIEKTAEGLLAAFQAKQQRLREYTQMMEASA